LVHDNLWGTNFPMWVEGDGRVRVCLSTATEHPLVTAFGRR
jgi:hypothetical protein